MAADATGVLRLGSPYTVRFGMATDAGCVRDANEDCVAVVDPSDPELAARKGVLMLVADGVGGAQGGEVASRIAAHVVTIRYYALPGAPADSLRAAFLEANREIRRFAETRPDLRGMGSTCTAMALENGRMHIAHVGDTRLYLIRNGGIYRMTEDHSATNEMVRRGLLTEQEARNHARRNVILRALGGQDDLEVAVPDTPVDVTAGDILLLCSDGLHDLVADDEIATAIAPHDPPAACDELVGLARARGGPDNITVAIAALERAGGGAEARWPAALDATRLIPSL